MRKLSLKSGMIRTCLMSFILFCSVFASQNVFSGMHWRPDFVNVDYDRKTGFINIVFAFYENTPNHSADAFLENCTFKFSDNNVNYFPLMSVSTEKQQNDKESRIKFFNKKSDQQILLHQKLFPSGKIWDNENTMYASATPKAKQFKISGKPLNTLMSYMTVSWKVPNTAKPIHFLCVQGDWRVVGNKSEKIYQVYYVGDVEKHSNVEKTTPSDLMSEISNNVKITKDADAIILTGAVAGENIEICTIEGSEMKSVVANNDVTKIKLQKSKKYIVKVGQESYKVVL